MKKLISAISLLLCLSLFLPSFPASAEESAAPEMGSFEEIMASYYDPNGRPMSCAHRAITYIGNPIPENSLAAIQDAIDHKVDIVELDIMRTKDGVYVLCHDSSIKRTTTYTGSLNVSDMTYEEICQYPLLQYTGGSLDVYRDENGNTLVMPTFEQALELCRGKIMINLDKFTGQWANRMELYEIVRDHGCLDIVMFKGGYDAGTILAWQKQIKSKYGTDAVMPNFCTMNSNRDAASWVKEIKAHHDMKTAFAVESGFSDYTQPQSDPEAIRQIKQYTRIFTNVLYESIGGTHSAKHKENPTGFAEVISLGYNIIQTNNSADLAAYIYANYSAPTKDASKGIDLLYFNGFKHYQTNYTIAISKPSVKLFDGDFISFRNVDFSGCDGNSLIVNIAGHSGKGELVIRKDSVAGEILASYDLSKVSADAVCLSETFDPTGFGLCEIYLCAENTGDGYVTVTRLTCTDPTEGEVRHIAGTSLFTRPGIAPALPSTVTLINEFGFSYEKEVTWSPIPEDCYAEELTVFTVPGVIRENCQMVYATVTVIDLDMSGAAIWFDSSEGVTLGASGEVLNWYDRISSVSATSNSGEAPLFKNDSIIFDGINDSMVYYHSLTGKSTISIIVNAKTDMKSTDYLSNYKINNSARYTLLHYPESGDWGSVYFTAFKNGIVCRFGSGVSNNRGIYYTGVSIEGFATVSAVKNKASEKLYLGSSMVYNRSSDSSAAHQAGTPGASIQATHDYAYIGLGIQSSVKQYYKGEVRDIIVFERTLSAAEIAVLDSYLSAKNQNTLKDKSDLVAAEFLSFSQSNAEALHDLDYTFEASSHTAVCAKCSYAVTEDHSFTLSVKDEAAHIKSCAICGYECEEEHNYQVAETVYKCSACGAEKPLPEKNGNATVIVAVSASVAAAIAVTFLAIYKKKKNK